MAGDYQRTFVEEKHRRFTEALSEAYLDIIILCNEFRNLLHGQKKSAVRRAFQPQSSVLNAHLDQAVTRFREHRKTVEKEAELCHMLEEKEHRELVQRDRAFAKAKERGKSDSTTHIPQVLLIYAGISMLIPLQKKDKGYWFHGCPLSTINTNIVACA
jgi:hypothetical protein